LINNKDYLWIIEDFVVEMDQIKEHPLYRKHNIDSAMNALWEFYKSRFVALFLISLAMSLVQQYATTMIDFKDLQSTTDIELILEKFRAMLVPILILMVVSLLLTTILHYYVLHKPIYPECNIFTCILRSLKYYIPYLIIVILLAFAGVIAIFLGLLVLIVGVFFSVTYIMMISMFILPVMMVEDANIGNTIARTIKLSHSNFWANMGWTAVFLILMIIISIILSGIVLIPFAGSFIKTMANPEDTSRIMNLTTDPLFIFLSSAVNALTLPLLPIFAFIIYFNGKAREEDINLPIYDNGNNGRVRVEDLYAKPRLEEDQDNE
jgi:hypothetical protein